MARCPNEKPECAKHCRHFGSHPKEQMCKNGVCVITFKHCECVDEVEE